MEKGIEIVARYHCPKEYFVEVTTEKSVLAGRDYWLCKKNSPRKVFMFSGKFKNEDQEVHQIIDQLKSSVKKYETTVISGSCIFGGKFVGTPAVS